MDRHGKRPSIKGRWSRAWESVPCRPNRRRATLISGSSDGFQTSLCLARDCARRIKRCPYCRQDILPARPLLSVSTLLAREPTTTPSSAQDDAALGTLSLRLRGPRSRRSGVRAECSCPNQLPGAAVVCCSRECSPGQLHWDILGAERFRHTM